jgi:hypothetical protein
VDAVRKFVFDELVKQTFLDHLERFGAPHNAARAVGTNIRRISSERKKDEEFDEACAESMEMFRESVEMELRRRAVDGVEEGVYYMGERIDTVRKYSDSLMTLLVKKLNPEYGDKLKVDTTITGGVLLTAAPAQSPEAWLEAQQRAALPPAQNEDQIDNDERVIDVTTAESDPVPA